MFCKEILHNTQKMHYVFKKKLILEAQNFKNRGAVE